MAYQRVHSKRASYVCAYTRFFLFNRVANLNSSEERTTNEPTSDETEIGTPQKDLTEITSATSLDGKTYKSKLNEYAQREGAKPYYEEIPSDDGKGFRSKVTVLGKTFVCKRSYSIKKNSEQMAAAEAMEYFNGLSEGKSSATTSAPHSTEGSMLDCKKIDNDNASSGKNKEQKNMTCEISSNNTGILPGIAEFRLEQASVAETAKPSSETSLTDNPNGKLMSAPKPHPNPKSALKEYMDKRQLGQALMYETTQDRKTNMFLSKVSVGKLCFKGKELKPKKEAEKHVAEVALNILEGRSPKPDCSFEKVLEEYHNKIGFPMFPTYEASCVDDGRLSVEVKVKKKYTFECKDAKPKKKDVGDWLAEQAVKVLEKENKISPAEGNPKSRLNLFFQLQGIPPPEYDFQKDQAKFTGSLCFYAVDVYESLAPQQTKEEATAFAAMSACNGMDLL